MSTGIHQAGYESLSDEQLVQRIQQRLPDCRANLNELIRRNHQDLLRRCHRYLRNWEDAQDAVQETELRILRGIDSFKGDAALRTWLFAIADNQCHSLATRRVRNIMGEHIRAQLELAVAPIGKTPQNQNSQVEFRLMVDQLLRSLPVQAAEILSLRFYADCSIEEIARILGIGLSAAKMRLYRSLRQAQGLLPDKDQIMFA